MLIAERTALTVAEFLERPDHERFELIAGELVERTMNAESVLAAVNIYRRFDDHRRVHPVGEAFPDGIGYALGKHSEHDFRKPDASVVLKSRLPAGWLSAAVFDFAPDLAVEVASPSDSLWQIERKVQEYLAAGSKLVWVVRPAMRRISAYCPDGSERTFGGNEMIDAEPVLPGFSFRVAEDFPPAELRT